MRVCAVTCYQFCSAPSAGARFRKKGFCCRSGVERESDTRESKRKVWGCRGGVSMDDRLFRGYVLNLNGNHTSDGEEIYDDEKSAPRRSERE